MLGGRRIVSLCISRLHNSENCRFIALLNKLLNDNNCSLLIYNITSDIYWDESVVSAETAVFDLINYEISDVVIIMDEKIKSHRISNNIIKLAHNTDVPVITVDGTYEGCISVDFDYAAGFEKIVRHVIEHHKPKHPHFIAGIKGNPFSDEREEIFMKVASENGIKVTSDMISYGNFWAKPAITAAEKLVSSGSIPDAVICANDITAINVCNVFKQHGIRIPEDTIVTGFDGLDEIYYSKPQITSGKCSSSELAKTVFSAVMDVFSGTVSENGYRIEPELIINQSCGCPTDPRNYTSFQDFNDRFFNYQDVYRVLSHIVDRIQSSEHIAYAACTLYSDVSKDICCVIDKKCIDNTRDHFSERDIPSDSNDMFMFFDADRYPLWQENFNRREIIPDLEKHICSGYPLIFNTIDYLNIPLGYVCFKYKRCDLTTYSMIPQIVSAIGRGIGGFMNMQYQKHLVSRIENMYRFDQLTGLYTRLSFNKEYENLLAAADPRPLTVILADLDGLKSINDTYGHSAGDNAIRTVAQALHDNCPPEALCVRFGGDEMLAVIPGDHDAGKIRDSIHATLEEYNKTSGNKYTVDASVGTFVTNTSADTDFETLVKNADKSMYVEKTTKKASH